MTGELSVPQGDFALLRYPEITGETLRAWDGADEHLLNHLAGVSLVTASTASMASEAPAATALEGVVVIVNDAWGALTAALARSEPTSVSDSALSQAATRRNLARADLGASGVKLIGPLDPLPPRIDVLLIRIPKTLSLLEFELSRLAPSLTPSSTVIATAMTKDVHTSTLEAFERWVGPTRTSLAARKARLIFSAVDPSLPPQRSDWPRAYPAPADLGSLSGVLLTNHAGIFSAERLDIGARFLLETLPAHLAHRSGPQRILDLGCGNGVLGVAAALDNPAAELTFVDESYLAVESARATFRAGVGTHRAARFLVGGTLPDAGVSPDSMDIVLNNPPFHSHQAISDATAWRMFSDSRTALRRGGELWVVGNRQLGYHAKLKRLFGNCSTVASNAKFVILRSQR